MTKTGLIAVFVGVAIIGAGIYWIAVGKNSPLGVSGEPDILLYVDEGDVSFKLPGAVFVRATTSPVAIVNGTQVHTGIGKATILFPNNSSAVLDTYTELTVTYAKNNVSLLQTLGTTYHRVESLITGGTYEVETPGTLAAVRGTKFAVIYDKKKKVTKVAVTESVVAVSKWKEIAGTSTKEILETLDLQKGKAVKVEEVRPATSTSAFVVVDIAEDKELSEWVEKNKIRDEQEETIRETKNTKEEVYQELKQLIESKEDAKRTPDEKQKNALQEESATPKKESVKETEPKPQPAPETRIETPVKPAVKMDEEAFFDAFTSMFLNYFYLDERDAPCGVRLSASERTKAIASFAAERGWPFESATLLSFAQEIDAYCKSKDQTLKIKLQGRFDQEFPYNESI